jgi:hypothetical protein
VDYVYYDLGYRDAGEAVIVEVDRTANVMLLDDSGLSSYRRRQRFQYVGGRATQSPVSIPVPRSGHWHVVIDLGGAQGSIRSSVSVA